MEETARPSLRAAASADALDKLRNEFYSFRSLVGNDFDRVQQRFVKMQESLNWESQRETANNAAAWNQMQKNKDELNAAIAHESQRETANNAAAWSQMQKNKDELKSAIDYESQRETANNNALWATIGSNYNSLKSAIDWEAQRETNNNTALWAKIGDNYKSLKTAIDWEAQRETSNNKTFWEEITNIKKNVQFEHDRETTNNTALWAKIGENYKTLNAAVEWEAERETSNNKIFWEEITSIKKNVQFEHDRETSNNEVFWKEITDSKNRITTIEENQKPVRINGNTDMNTLVKKGIYSVHKPGCLNLPPTSNNFVLEVIPFYPVNAPSYILQRATQEGGGLVYERQLVNNVWRAWERTNFKQSELNDLKDKDIELTNLIKNESDDRKSADTTINNKLVTINQAIRDLNDRIDGFNWSDLGIIAAITASTKANTDLWTADIYDGASVGENDGKAVRLFKNQFQGLKSHFAWIMKNYFDMNDKESAIYKLRYSIVAGFEETKTLLADQLPKIIESQGTTNIYLDAISTWLELQDKHFKTLHSDLVIIIQWLSEIFKKPFPSVVVTDFDFVKLQELLESLEFNVGEITNEAGTNIWDVIESLLDNLGNALGEILDFLDSLLDKLIGLVVPSNLDFLDNGFGSLKGKFDVKFGGILNLGDQIKDIFTPNRQDFFKAISFTFMGATFEPDSSATDLYVPTFRTAMAVFIWLYVAWFAYVKVTGKGDLINDN